MGITFVQSVTVLGGASATHTLTLASAVEANDCITFLGTQFTPSTNTPALTSVTDNKGNGPSGTYAIPSGSQAIDGGGDIVCLATAGACAATAANGTVVTSTMTGADDGGNYNQFSATVMRGVQAAANPTNSANSAVNLGPSSTIPSVNLSPTVANTMGLSVSVGDVGTDHVGSFGGTTGTAITLNSGAASSYGIIAGTGTQAASYPSDPDDLWLLAAIALTPAASSGPPPDVIGTGMNF